MTKFRWANNTKTQYETALIKYGTISLMIPPAREKATVASTVPFGSRHQKKVSVG
jgi:hypothetical protein